ncbi:asparagine synthase-related protein [Myxococcota bacterium]
MSVSSETLQAVQRKLEKRAEERGFHLLSSVSGSQHVFNILSSCDALPCERAIEGDNSALAWTGHTVDSSLGLWPDATDLNNWLGNDAAGTLNDLEGVYSLAHLDRAAGQLLLATDRYGMSPLYVLRQKNALLFSSSVDLLIYACNAPLTINQAAIAEYLHFHHCLADKTFVSEINRLPQGCFARFHIVQGNWRRETYFDYTSFPTPSIFDSSVAVGELVPALRHAVKRRLDPRTQIVCLLSGGFDSRSLCATLSKLEVPYRTLTTYGDTGNLDDPEGARLVADMLRVENTYLPLPSDYLARHWRAKCLMSDFATTMHTWLMPLTLQHRDPLATNLDGIAGDVVLKGLLLRESELELLASGDRPGLVEAVLTNHRMGAGFSRVVEPRVGHQWLEMVRSVVDAELARGDGHPNTLSAFVLRNRTRRAIGASPCNILAWRLNNLMPFFDFELLTLGLSVVPDLKLSGDLYREVIAKIVPELNDVPSSNDKEWPSNFPRRTRPRYCTADGSALHSYLDEIERGRDLMPGIITPAWFEKLREAVRSEPAVRCSVMHEAQAIGELFFWLSTYADQVSMDFS